MEKPVPSRGILRFGVFEADLKSGELRKNGSKLRLQEQPFQVLALLLQNPGESSPASNCGKPFGPPIPSWISTTV